MSGEQQPSSRLNIFERILARMPSEIRASLSQPQIDALAVAFNQPQATHLVDNRISIRWMRQYYYVRLLIGHERRSLSRVMREQHIKLGRAVIAFAVVIWLFVSVVLTAIIVVLYLVKSAYGFDLFDGPSFFHSCFFN